MTDRQRKIEHLEKLIAANPEAFKALPEDKQASIQHLIATKDVPTPLAPKRPLVNRCECGRQISDHRFRCLACQTAFLTELGQQIDSQDLLDATLKRSAAGAEKVFLEQLRPYLKFEPAPLA